MCPDIALVAVSYTHLDVYKRQVFVFDKFTIPADKMLVVEMHEKSGGRHQTFTVESEDLSLIHI